MACYHLSSSRNGTRSNPEGVYRTRGYSPRQPPPTLINAAFISSHNCPLGNCVGEGQTPEPLTKLRPERQSRMHGGLYDRQQIPALNEDAIAHIANEAAVGAILSRENVS